MTLVLDDRDLVRAHQAGDPDAFAEIVARYHGSLLSQARRRLGDSHAAEDAVQETFLRGYRALPRFNGEYRLGAWLRQILTNVCADEAGRRLREVRLLDRARGPAPREQVEPDAATQARVPDPLVADAFEQLPPTYQEALQLRYIQDLPYEEVAARSGVTEANARARVHRASKALRHVFISSGGALGAFLAWAAAITRRGERLVVGGSAQAAAGAGGEIAIDQAVVASHATPAATQVVAQVTNLAAQVAPAVVQAATQAAAAPDKVTMFTKVAVAAVAAVAVPATAVGVHSITTSPAPSRVEAPSLAPPAGLPEGRITPATTEPVVGDEAGDGSVTAAPASPDSRPVPAGAPGRSPDTTKAPSPAPPVSVVPAPLAPREGSITAAAPLGRVLGDEIVAQGPAMIDIAGVTLGAQLTANFGVPELQSPGEPGPVRMSAVVREAGGAVFRLRGALVGAPEAGSTYRYGGTFDVVGGDAAGLPAKGTFTLRFTVPTGFFEGGIGTIGSVAVAFEEARDTGASVDAVP